MRELFWTPMDGNHPPRKLNGPLPPGGQVSYAYAVTLTRDGKRVLYVADQEQYGLPQLFLAQVTPHLRRR